jgi:four helix bundle protein
MTLQRIEDFEVWKRAMAFWVAVNAIVERPCFAQELRLRSQIKEAIDSILSNMSEGFEQPTDKAFAKYLYVSKGSTAETCTRLSRSLARGLIAEGEFTPLRDQGIEIRRLLTGLIKHLMKTPDRRRGLGPTP